MSLKVVSPDFQRQVFYIGLDTHNTNWKVSIRTRDMHLKTFCMNPSPEELNRHMNRHYPGGIYKTVYEAGFCGYWIHRKLSEYHFENLIVNPSDVPSTDKEREQKSDPIDSAKLSRERANNSLKGIFVPSVHQEALRCLHRLYKQNIRRITQLKNRIKGYLHFTGIPIPEQFPEKCWSYNFLKFLSSIPFTDPIHKTVMDTLVNDLVHARKTRTSILAQIRKASKDVPIIQLLKTIPGIGPLMAFILYAELVDIHRFRNLDHLASFVGLVPSVQSTDQTVIIRGITPRHSTHLRASLIESAWVATRNDAALLYAFNQLTKTMKKNEAIVRIAKKLLNRIRFVWKNQVPYVTGLVAIEPNPKP
jgi:transposase